jgi:hypothetical protein
LKSEDELEDRIVELLDNDEPNQTSTDKTATTSQRIWLMMGEALNALKTNAKTIVNAINEIFDALANKLSLSGGTMSGYINMGANDIENVFSISTKGIANQDGTRTIFDIRDHTEADGTPYFNVYTMMNVMGKKIRGVGEPVANTDAATKQYVDTLEKMYQHSIYYAGGYTNQWGSLTVINRSTEPINTVAKLAKWLNDNGYNGTIATHPYCGAEGTSLSGNMQNVLYGIRGVSQTTLQLVGILNRDNLTAGTVTDNVREI